jgi:glycerophosphoryl diester phosphodiesterase
MTSPRHVPSARWAFAGLMAMSVAVSHAALPQLDGPPIVIGHRGAAGHLPEHTLEGYALAIDIGADFVEPDLVATKDGALIARHEPNLIATTNVKDIAKFASRQRVAIIDGIAETGFFASDFTLAEIKELRAVQAVPTRDQGFNGLYKIPTLREIIALVKRKTLDKGRTIGIYPETKHPTYHKSLGLPLEDRLLDELTLAGWNYRNAPVYIQSFETANLRELRAKTRVHLIQLVDADGLNPDGTLSYAPPYDKPYDWVVSGRQGLFSDLVTPAGLAEVATYADGIGPWKYYLQSTACKVIVAGVCGDANGDGLVNEADRTVLPPTDVIAHAHAGHLRVHPYTFRSELSRLPLEDLGTPTNEYQRFFQLGVDGVFADFPDSAYAGRSMFLLKAAPAYRRCLLKDEGCSR